MNRTISILSVLFFTSCLSFKPNPNVPPLYIYKEKKTNLDSVVYKHIEIEKMSCKKPSYKKDVYYFGLKSKYDTSEINKTEYKNEWNKLSQSVFFVDNIYKIPEKNKTILTAYFQKEIDSLLNIQKDSIKIVLKIEADVLPFKYDYDAVKELKQIYNCTNFLYNEYCNAIAYNRAKEVTVILNNIVFQNKNKISHNKKRTIILLTTVTKNTIEIGTSDNDKKSAVRVFYSYL